MTQNGNEKNQKQNGGESFDELIQKKFDAERELEEKFTQTLTLLATDIRGSTELQRTRGDIAAAAILNNHNRILEPILKKHGGRIINMTDGAFVAFGQGAENAVHAAIQFMREVRDFNTNTKDKINVRVGLHHGPVIVRGEKDIEGLAVSTTARVEQAMKAFEQKNKELGKTSLIFISQAVYQEIRSSEDIICRWADKVEAKGLDEPMDLYRVIWDPENEQVFAGTKKVGTDTRGVSLSAVKRAMASLPTRTTFVLEISMETDKLKVCGYEKSEGEAKTMRHYEGMDVDHEKIDKYISEIFSLLNRSTQPGSVSKEILNKLKSSGQILYDELFNVTIKEKLASTKSEDLILNIDDTLVHIPWELIYDGNSFLSLRFNMGRVVRTRQAVSERGERHLGLPLKMIILADPKNNLKAASREGVNIRNTLEAASSPINVNVKTGNIKSSYILEKIRNFDMVHYAGHSDYDKENPAQSGWALEDGKFMAVEFKKMVGSQPMPALVFSNACHSGQTDEWKISRDCETEIFGMANAFLLAGVQHYIGTFWEILDEPSLHFSVFFYEQISKNKTIGESVRLARKSLIKKYGEENIIWASYMLYGDPTALYIPLREGEAEAQQPMEKEKKAVDGGALRSGEESMVFPQDQEVASQRQYWLLGIAVAAILVVGIFLLYQVDKTEVMMANVQETNKMLAKKQAEVQKERIDVKTAAKDVALSTKEKERRQKIDTLVADLAKQYREGQTGSTKTADADEWTSRPLVISLLPMKIKGEAGNVSQEAVLNGVQEALGEEKRVSLVDRELVDKLLEELKLSSSELADKQTALRIGRLVGARFIATGNVFTLGGKTKLSMKLLETETTSIVKTASVTGKLPDSLQEMTASLSKELAGALMEEFPLKGKVVGFAEDKVVLNIGKNHGILKKDKFKVIQEKLVEGSEIKIKTKVGMVEVTDIDDTTSLGTVLEKTGPVEKGMKVILDL